MGKKKQIRCPNCDCEKRSDKLESHLVSIHGKTPLIIKIKNINIVDLNLHLVSKIINI